MANVYSGNAVMDDRGEAWVELPRWLEALNTDFRYQLTCIGKSAPVFIAQEVAESRFKIAGDNPGLKVSWQLTGIRKDLWALTHPLIVEKPKDANERGLYQHPEVHNQETRRPAQALHFRLGGLGSAAFFSFRDAAPSGSIARQVVRQIWGKSVSSGW
jgi:hypothetical protein